jgi:DeoR family fructose operon transcriptional repressor
MIAQERWQSITDLLARRQKLSVHDLARELGVSGATLRRDLAELESAGRVVRVRGAVVHPGYFGGEPSFAQKKKSGAREKRAIALAAVELVPPNSSVLVDAGTTCLEAGRLLLARRDVTVITHSLPLACLALETTCNAKVICIGGEVRAISGAAVGALPLSWLERISADCCLVGASGLSSQDGASTTELSECAVKQAMLQRSQRKILLAEASKWEKPATVNFASWSDFDFWVCSPALGQGDVKSVQACGPRVVEAKE